MKKPTLVFDGECPFCVGYLRVLKLEETFPDLDLVDARSIPRHEAAEVAWGSGIDIDEGIVLFHNNDVYHGVDAIHQLANLRNSMYGVNELLFASRRRSSFLYPILRAGRRLALRILRRGRLHL